MRITKDPETRRAELISAARQLFDQNGIEKTQVSQIVKKVGVAQGLFYYYFKSKEEVVEEVMRLTTQELRDQTEAILSAQDVPFYQKLSRYIELYLQIIDQFSGDQEENLRSMLEVFQQNAMAGRAQQLMQEALEALIRQGLEQGALPHNYGQDMAKMVLYGLLELSREKLFDRAQLAAMIEQGLGLPNGCLCITQK